MHMSSVFELKLNSKNDRILIESTTKYNVCRLIKIWVDLFGFGLNFELVFLHYRQPLFHNIELVQT